MEPPRPARWKRRLLLLIVAVLAHVVVGLALFTLHVPSTDVRLELRVDEVGFTSSTRQPLITDPMAVTLLGLSGLAGVDLPLAASPGSESYREPSLLLMALPHGTIHLDPWSVPARIALALRSSEVAGEYRLSLEGAVPELGVSLLGPVQTVVPRVLNERRDFARPRRVGIQTDSDVVDIEFALAPGQGGGFAARLGASDLRLDRVERFDGEFVPVSTVLDGRLFFVTLGKEGPAFERSEAVRFARSEGEVRGLQPAGDHVALTFAGRVRGMSMGTGVRRLNLMPTWLDWLLAQTWLSLAAKAYLGLLAIVAAAVQWLDKLLAWLRK